MRIALFTDTYYPETNGVSRTLQRLAAFLKKTGHNVKVVAPAYDNCDPSWDIVRIPGKSFFLYPACQLAFPGQEEISRRMDSFRPDLIHVATPAGIGLAGRRYAVNRGIPLAASYHTNFNLYLADYGLNFLEPLYWTYLRWFHRPCACNFCPSRSTMETLRQQGFPHLSIWSRGVDSRVFNPANRDESLRKAWGAEDKTVLLYVGRLAREKHVESFFAAYRLLPEDVRKHTKPVIVGQGPLMEGLRQEAPAGTVFTGVMEGKELACAYASGDIFAFTSPTETFGNVLLEAMASGLPVISPRAGGALESLREGKNGLGFDPGDINGFACGMQKLLENRVYRLKLAQGARDYALQQSWDIIFDRLVDVYFDVAGKNALAV